MNKIKKTFRRYQKYAYNNTLNDLTSAILSMDKPKEYTPDNDIFRDGWNAAIEKVVELIEEAKK